MCVSKPIIINVSGVFPPINPSYFDVNKRATFVFDPVRHMFSDFKCGHMVFFVGFCHTAMEAPHLLCKEWLARCEDDEMGEML